MAGRKPFQATKEQRNMVQAMTGYGVPQEDICRVIINPTSGKPIDEKTLRRVFRTEIDTGTVIANSKVAESLYNKALGTGQGAVTAAIFWLKTRAGWKEVQVMEHTGKDGAPIATKQEMTNIDPVQAAQIYQDFIAGK
jgi:hypothetical protein